MGATISKIKKFALKIRTLRTFSILKISMIYARFCLTEYVIERNSYESDSMKRELERKFEKRL